MLVADLDRIAGDRHDAFDQIGGVIDRRDEDDDVVARRSQVLASLAEKRNAKRVGHLVDEQVVADLDVGSIDPEGTQKA